MGLDPSACQAAGGENPFSRTAGWLTSPSGRRLERRRTASCYPRCACVPEWPRRDYTCASLTAGRYEATLRASTGSVSTKPIAVVDRQVGRVQDRGVGGSLERRCRPRGVARVALLEFAQKTFKLTEIPFSINCLWRRRARSSALAVTNTLTGASGNTTVPMSRPSATSPGGWRKARWRASSAARTPGGRPRARRRRRLPRRGSRAGDVLAVEPDARPRRSAAAASAASRASAARVVQRRRRRAAPAARPAGRARRCRGGGSRAPGRPRRRPCPCPTRPGRRRRSPALGTEPVTPQAPAPAGCAIRANAAK